MTLNSRKQNAHSNIELSSLYTSHEDTATRIATSYFFVDSEWLAANLLNADLKVVEIDLDSETAYARGHIPGAHLFLWNQDLGSKSGKEILDRQAFERLMSRIGATRETTIVLYGDSDNLLAIFAFWIFQYYGHDNVRVLADGRNSWPDSGRLYTRIPAVAAKPSRYVAAEENTALAPDFAKASRQIGLILSNHQYLDEVYHAE